MKKNYLLAVSVLLTLFILVGVGCSGKEEVSEVVYDQEDTSTTESGTGGEVIEQKDNTDDSKYDYEGSLLLKGLSEDVEVKYNDIYAMESVEETVFSVTSSGEENEDTVVGVYLDDVLELYGETQRNYSTIRLIAMDGYEVTLPEEIVAGKNIILAYEFNGEGLDEKKQPLRVAIDDVRSMYFVSQLSEIIFFRDEEEVSISRDIVFLETAFSQLPSDDFMYYDSNDQAILVSDLFEAFGIESEKDIEMLASDGYEKQETMEVVQDGFIKYTGDDAPLFTGLDLSKGMNVKFIMKMNVDKYAFISVASTLDSFETSVINDVSGILLSEIIELAGLEASTYYLTADDGYSVEVTAESLKDAVVVVADSGTVSVTFAKDYGKSKNVKNLLTITSSVESTEDEKSEEDTSNEEDNEESLGLEAWTIIVEGLSDGSFDLTSERAERKLELIDLHTERMKNEETYPEDWQGYKVLEILDFLHVDEFSSLVFIANDGYEVELTQEQIDDETIIAVIKNGEVMSGDNQVQLVQNTEFATTWIKGLVTIIVK